ncbi:hypothetical protein [Truepera radiovictrix]|uniref:Quinate 5-dehydrogenase n=1 Tax=Truepera radiovictrix (strain DSM 17093 / CIP 108686 / LMG 22925 / RQ-24) TaxID=649638 RepID=D7CVX7_TRURR|nr:hypothetical protein [Truepera radiovictrix]ADI14240.1 conserved hypothetical protein [Truepera radiovictrix DSM 17093]WMT57203.1 quinate 5-dehydrogenase [Truepera radiovictrix]
MGAGHGGEPTKRVVSVSLSAASRDVEGTLELLGETVALRRVGTDGDRARAAALIRELDGTVDAIGLGGINLYVYVGSTRFRLRDAARLAALALRTPVVDGSGLKRSLEGRVVAALDARERLAGRRVLMVSAVDRHGMAQAFRAAGAEVRYGDLAFLVGVPYVLRSAWTLQALGYALAPIAKELPIELLYPTGAAQEREQRGWVAARLGAAYAWAEVIAGDWHLIRRYLPERLTGKVIVTNTTTAANVALLREREARLLVTTTPRLGDRSLATNLLEAAFVAVSGGEALTQAALDDLVARAGLCGTFTELQP